MPKARWQAAAQTGEHWSARYLVMAAGPLSSFRPFTGPDKKSVAYKLFYVSIA
jgi:hypothetical protein